MKGNRKRSNVNQVKKVETKPVEKKEEPNIIKQIDTKFRQICPVRTFTSQDANLVNGIFQLSNNLAKLKKQYVDDETTVLNKNNVLKSVDSGKLKFPMMKQLGEYMVMVSNKSEFKKSTLQEIEEYKKQQQITVNQMRSNYNGFVDSLTNLKSILDEMLSHVPKGSQTISAHRGVTQKQEEEKKLFEEQFHEMLKKEEAENQKKLEEIKLKAKNKK